VCAEHKVPPPSAAAQPPVSVMREKEDKALRAIYEAFECRNSKVTLLRLWHRQDGVFRCANPPPLSQYSQLENARRDTNGSLHCRDDCVCERVMAAVAAARETGPAAGHFAWWPSP
jgi:hypothetical protein